MIVLTGLPKIRADVLTALIPPNAQYFFLLFSFFKLDS